MLTLKHKGKNFIFFNIWPNDNELCQTRSGTQLHSQKVWIERMNESSCLGAYPCRSHRDSNLKEKHIFSPSYPKDVCSDKKYFGNNLHKSGYKFFHKPRSSIKVRTLKFPERFCVAYHVEALTTVRDPPHWPRDPPLSTKVRTKFCRQVAVAQSI
jgi:hypothetical protein